MEKLALASPRSPAMSWASQPPLQPFGAGGRISTPAALALPISKLRSRRCRIAAAAGRGGTGSDAGKFSGRKVVLFAKLGFPGFASVSSQATTTTSASAPPPVPPPAPSYFGGPILWICVGVGLSAVLSTITARTKKYLMQQAFKSMFDQAAPNTAQFGNSVFPGGSPFPFPAAPHVPPNSSSPATSVQTPALSQPLPFTVKETITESEKVVTPEILGDAETKKEAKKFAFVDISREELLEKEREFAQESGSSSKDSESETMDSQNGAAHKPHYGASAKPEPVLSVDALEKMMEDPTVQKMVYPYLPEEMRNPTTFKWMLQNPQYRQQLQDILDKMGGTANWDSQMMENLKGFDLSSPEVKQQFEQIGLTPEEVVSKIMANPDVTQAFQNPKIQAAIMDCSQNPMNIAKYQNDKEIMDVFMRISELFPGVGGM